MNQNLSTAKVSFYTAVSLVVANMIGAGVFTSLGYQVLGGVTNTFPLLMLWLVGGIVALCGALSYGELAGMMPRSGGEYHFLSKIYHPAYGFLSGWASMWVGFAAPIALSAMALGRYVSAVFPALPEQAVALSVLVLITLIHATDLKLGSIFQIFSTSVKVTLIIVFIGLGLLLTPEPQPVNLLPVTGDWSMIFSGGFAVSLAFVSFAYSGWNASAYLATEIENPQRNVPRSLFLGTLAVMIAYLLLNFVFLYTVPAAVYGAEQAKLGTSLEVGYVSAQMFLGGVGSQVMGMVIALLLISSISAMVFAGPRVTQVMGQDLHLLRFWARTNAKGIPSMAIVFQSLVAAVLILTSTFDQVLFAIAFTLDIFTFSTVLGVFVMRLRTPSAPRPYRTWGYPITPLIFLAATGWTMYFIFTTRTKESLVALAIVGAGLLVYLINEQVKPKTQNN
ncbi:APC family permease [Eisenibacter elegans]|jgi:APA family basic amino acid/polyamine antiporter|uniref:APC family permease n=1 Tax=Eisenibacter elegans TaxID=997 RepID=UPI0003F9E2F5|nr:APC family permease [Eisenibacter elegans]